MPIREFRCLLCDKTFETLIFHQEEEEGLTCPLCGSKSLTRLISIFARIGGGEETATSKAGCTSCSAQSCSTCH